MSRIYILYDARACGNAGTDEAVPLDVCKMNEEAIRSRELYGQCACYSYEDRNPVLLDPRWEWDFFPDSNN